MTALLVDPRLPASELRKHIYEGDIVVLSHLAEVTDLVVHARERLEELFGPHDPRRVHDHHSPEELAPLLGSWKPRFIHDPVSKQLVTEVIKAIGFSDSTHFDVPKPRTAFPIGHLTTGVAFAFPWHRDTWYSAPKQQINWWLPIYEITADNAMMFDLEYFGRPIVNTSREFDYYAINEARRHTATQVKRELQARPEAVGHEPANPFIVLGQPGSVMLFSGAHLHASVPNATAETRYSIDFRTVDSDDVEADVGAELVDSDCTGTALRDFVGVADGRAFDENLVQRLYGRPPEGSTLVFAPPGELGC